MGNIMMYSVFLYVLGIYIYRNPELKLHIYMCYYYENSLFTISYKMLLNTEYDIHNI